MKGILYSCLLLMGISWIIVGCNKSDTVTTLSEVSFQTSSISLYSDGYYGHTMDQPFIIEDKLLVDQMIEIASKVDAYSMVEEDDLLEGLNGLWVDFNNGTIIGMYEDRDYGNVGPEISLIGAPYYHLPKGLRSLVIEILKVNREEVEKVAGIKFDNEYVFDEARSLGMKQLQEQDIHTIIEMHREEIEVAIEKIARKDIVLAEEPNIALGALKMNNQQLKIIVGCYIEDVYHKARVTGVFKDEVEWFAMDLGTELEPLSQIINRRLGLIMSNKEVMLSSNPYDYTEGNKDYDYLVGLGTDALDIMLEKLRDSEENGLEAYILAIVCSEILGEDIKSKTWSTGKEWYDLYSDEPLEDTVEPLAQPPTLKVTCNKQEVMTSHGTVSWYSFEGDADPEWWKGNMFEGTIEASQNDHIELAFDVEPIRYSVTMKVENQPNIGVVVKDNQFSLKNGQCEVVYEIKAFWEEGNAYYVIKVEVK